MIAVKFEGAKELEEALKSLPEALSMKVQRDALREGAEPMRAHAAALAPRGPDAPHLADNIVVGIPRGVIEELHDDVAVVAVGPQKDFFYGFFWEYGTIKLPARPFMRPAFDTQHQTSLQIVGSLLWKAIAAARGSRGRSTGVGV